MNTKTLRFTSLLVAGLLLLQPNVILADLGELTAPVKQICARLLTSKEVLLGNSAEVRFKVDRAEALAKEVEKESPNIPQVISDLITITPPPSLGVKIFKRAVDITAGFFGLLLTAPLYPVIATAIYLDSPGPIFYKQQRSGVLQGGVVGEKDPAKIDQILKSSDFKMWKFRSMIVDAEKNTGAVLAKKDDDRITRVGKFLRKTRLDEIPQFINVLKGDMSLVGPRPERRDMIMKTIVAVPYFAERMRDTKPGITGLAQVSLSYSGGKLGDKVKEADLLTEKTEEDKMFEDFENKLLHDLVYRSQTSSGVVKYLITETWIIVKTPITMIKGVGR